MRVAAFDLEHLLFFLYFASQEMRVAAFDLEHLLANLLDVRAYRRVRNLD
jgi:hypothetical protein